MNKLFIIAAVFLVLGGYMIIQAHHYDLENKDDKKSFIKSFFSWVWKVGGNIKQITGLAVEQKWLPETNSSNTTEVQ